MAGVTIAGVAGTARRRAGSKVTGLVLSLVLVGCTSGDPSPSRPVARPGVDRIEELHLFGLPVGLELDGRPGADGIGVRLYASAAGTARGLAIRRGTLDVLMFEGAMDGGMLQSTPPHEVWSFPASGLPSMASRTSLGVGYQLALRWRQAPPRSPVVTVVARYLSPEGTVLYSAPDVITMSLR